MNSSNSITRLPAMRTGSPAVLALLALALMAPSLGRAAQGSVSRTENLFGSDSCTETSNAAYSSCYFEGQEEYWIGWGSCSNTTDLQDRNACFNQNSMALAEKSEECLEQLAGREDVCEAIGQGRYDPEYEAEDFVDPAAIGDTVEPNPWFPLVPGNRWVYQSEEELIVVEVMEETKEIDGVTCVVVRDTVTEVAAAEAGGDEENAPEEDGDEDPVEEQGTEGDLIEDTTDWYAQDAEGNVWYFGEIAKNYEDGELADVEGSWKAGEDGARPGIVMPAMPTVGEVYRQEFLLGDAEDMAEVVSVDAMPELAEDNPGSCDSGCLQTGEWTPIEPDVLEYKYYQAGVGMVMEEDPETGENLQLVEFSN